MSDVYAHCVHFDGPAWLDGGTCAAGVDYRTVRIDPPIRASGELPVVLPCHAHARGVAEADRCPLRRWPTPEEVEAQRAETERAVKAILSGACPRCGTRLQSHPRSGGGYVERCPAGCGTGSIACGRSR